MKSLQTISAALSIINFVGSSIAAFVGNQTATWMMLGLAGLFFIVWFIVWFVVRRRDPEVQRFKGELEITAERKNRQHIDGTFLGWRQCTLMLWVLIPPEGEGLRKAPDYRYILAHQTNDSTESENRNFFALRYTPDEHWQVAFTNEHAQYPPESLVIPDGLQAGWHHFQIRWDHSKPEIVFRIDEGRNGDNRSTTYLTYWPKRQAQNVMIGAWITTDPYSSSYCETTLYELQLFSDYLEPNDKRIRNHLKLDPKRRR